jgi:hypothetical protein
MVEGVLKMLKQLSSLRRIEGTISFVAMGILALAAKTSLSHEMPQTVGDRQISQLLDDRPAMKGILDSEHFVYKWVVQQFSAGDSKKRVYWEDREPVGGREAENQPTLDYAPPFIRITRSDKISGRDKWLMLVFELHNLKNAKAFEELEKRAVSGEIDRDKFSNECLELEFKAMVQTQIFFKRNPVPGVSAKADPYFVAYLNGSSSFDDYKKMLNSDAEDAYDPRNFYADRFDSVAISSFKYWEKWWNRSQSR